MMVEISMMVAVVGCFVGLAGWLTSRDKRISGDAEWRGQVNAKLDTICGLSRDLGKLERDYQEFGQRLATVESSAKQAHHRLDTMEGKLK